MKTPFPVRPRPGFIFRIVKRDERATYVRIMRRTYAVHLRDANRSLIRLQRSMARAMLPAIKAIAAFADRMGKAR